MSLSRDELHRNSFFLMLSTGLMGGLGFIFWLIASHFYNSDSIGSASSLISISGLLIAISNLGFPNTLIRYLPKSSAPNSKISSAVVLTSASSLLSCSILWIVSKFWLPGIFDQINTFFPWLVFLLSVLTGTWQQIADGTFIAYKRTEWVLLESSLFSFSKIILIYPLVVFGSFGIFTSHMFGVVFSTFASFLVLILLFKLQITLEINYSIIKEIGKYSAASYLSGLVTMIPSQLLPAIVASSLGSTSAAHFFLALMIVNLMSIVPQASSQSLFAICSEDPTLLKSLSIKSIKSQILLVVASLMAVWFFSPILFSFFGKGYLEGVGNILKILSISIIPITLGFPFTTRLRIKKQLVSLNYLSIFGSTAVLVSSIVGAKSGLSGLAYGFLLGQILSCIALIGHYYLLQVYETRQVSY